MRASRNVHSALVPSPAKRQASITALLVPTSLRSPRRGYVNPAPAEQPSGKKDNRRRRGGTAQRPASAVCQIARPTPLLGLPRVRLSLPIEPMESWWPIQRAPTACPVPATRRGTLPKWDCRGNARHRVRPLRIAGTELGARGMSGQEFVGQFEGQRGSTGAGGADRRVDRDIVGAARCPRGRRSAGLAAADR